MKDSIFKKAGVIISVVLVISLSIMLIILLGIEENLKHNKTLETTSETVELIKESIIYAMAQGADDVQPFVEGVSHIKKLVEVRITPTDIIEEGNEAKLDAEERSVLNKLETSFYEEEYNDLAVFRAIEPILSTESCTDCHDTEIGEALAIVSIRYSIDDTYSAIASQRIWAFIMAISTIGLAFIVVMFFLRKEIVAPIQELTDFIERVAKGEKNVCVDISSEDEIGRLATSFSKMNQKLTQQLDYLENLPTTVMTINKEYDITYINKKGAEILGKTSDEIIGQKCFDNFKTGDCNTEKCSCAQAMLKNDVFTEETIANPNHQEVPIIYTGSPILDEKGEIVGAIEFVMDTTELKEIQNYLARSTNALLKEMEDFALGDLTVSVNPEKTDDEIGRLFIGFNQAISKIRGILENVQQAVDATASASNQISSSTEEMAAGAQEQSTQTTEVAGAIEQMTATIVETTRNASRAAEAASDAGAIAKSGGNVVQKTVEGMNAIFNVVKQTAITVEELGENSQKIGEIISVIDDIADQTNLLALNAAIEAARAGEQGRGFAVVADEVRKLAERTTKATKEISDMIKQIQTKTAEAVASINEGTVEVERGKEMAYEAGRSLTEIIEGSEKVVDIIGQVAAASEEQSSAAELVSRNVEGISTVANESAAGVHQVARAAEDLNQLTNNLQEIIGSFVMEKNGTHKLLN